MRLSLVAGAVALLAGFASPVLAKGPGKYAVQGLNADGSKYKGNVTISKIGQDNWRIISVVGSDKYDGYGIGDEDVLAVTYSGGGTTFIALYVAQPDGSYKGVWAAKGDTKVSAETLTPQ